MDLHYLDNSATTPLCDAAKESIKHNMDVCFGNPSSLHGLGVEAERLVSEARKEILNALGFRKAKPEQLVFTASGTEAANMAIIGTATAKARNKGKRIIIGETEHECVRESAAFLERNGYEVIRIPSPDGVWDMAEYRNALNKNVILVSAMTVNNETGAVNNVSEIFSMAKSVNPDVITHTDAVQAFMKTSFPLSSTGADLISISGHKICAPKGVGALYIDSKVLTTKSIVPVIYGGGQEKGLRSGTENTLGIAAFGAAAKYHSENLKSILSKYDELYAYLVSELSGIEGVRVNVPETAVIAKNIINITVSGIRSETTLHYLSEFGVYVSSGSACASNTGHKSYVLKSFGLSDGDIDSSIRVSLGGQNTKEDIDAFCTALKSGISRLVKSKKG